MDFHLEATDDISWDDDIILPARNPSSLEVKKMTESIIELCFSLLVFAVHTLTKISYIHSDQTPSFCVYRKMKMLVMTRKCSDPIFKHQRLGISAKDMTWLTLPPVILAEANEIQDVKEAIQALMIREEEDAANSPTI